MRLNNKQLSLLITVLTMSIIMLTLYNIRLSGQQEEEFLYEMAFEDLPEIPQEPEPADMSELETHKAYNEAEESKYSKEIEELKTLEELTEERRAAEAENSDPDSNDDLSETAINTGFAKKFAEKLQEQKERLAENKKINEKNEKVNIKRRTTISYSLVKRSDILLPNPVYTCESFGKVVINITVDASGNVTDASYNEGSSTTRNGCLIDNAIAYALKAKFTKDPSGKPTQLGTITYQFQGE